MGRTRTIPDADIFTAVRTLLAQGGEKAVAFSTVARATGLAAPTLVQRYGSRDAMLRAALMAAWDTLDAATAAAAAEAPLSPKGAAQFLKALSADEAETSDLTLLGADFRDPALRASAPDSGANTVEAGPVSAARRWRQGTRSRGDPVRRLAGPDAVATRRRARLPAEGCASSGSAEGQRET